MLEIIYNICIVLFPLTGIVGGFVHYLIFLNCDLPFPRKYVKSLLVNVIVTSITGLIVLVLYTVYG